MAGMKFASFALAAVLCAASAQAAERAATISALRSIKATTASAWGRVTLEGYYKAGDFGAPESFVWSPSSISADNGCTVIQPADRPAAGRWLLHWTGSLKITQCGAREDGTFNDAPALAATLAAAERPGATIVLPCGAITLPSASLESAAPFRVPPHTIIRGERRSCAIVTVTGTSEVNRLFVAENPSQVWFESFTLRGNSIATHSGDRGAIFFSGTPAARGPMKDFGLRDMALENFRQDYWVSVENASPYDMQGVVIDGALIRTFPNNDRDDRNIAVPSDIFAFRGQEGGAKGVVDGISVTGADADGEFVKAFAVFWAGTRNGHVERNTLRNFGARVASDAGGYALLTYDSSYGKSLPPTAMWIVENMIVSPRSCGWYGAGTLDVHIDRNTISGQSDGADATLPKGAIAFNGSTGEASGNTLSDNVDGIEVALPPSGSIRLSGNAVTSARPHAKGIVLDGEPPRGPPPVVTLDQNTVSLVGDAAVALVLVGDARAPLGIVDIRGGSYRGTYADVLSFDRDRGEAVASAIHIEGVALSRAPSNRVQR